MTRVGSPPVWESMTWMRWMEEVAMAKSGFTLRSRPAPADMQLHPCWRGGLVGELLQEFATSAKTGLSFIRRHDHDALRRQRQRVFDMHARHAVLGDDGPVIAQRVACRPCPC